MIALLITLFILALVIGVLVWLCRYMGFPGIVEKVLIVLGVLFALLILLDFFGYGPGLRTWR